MLTSQQVFPPVQEPTFSGEVAAGYFKNCFPFAVGATVSLVVVSLDLASDWIMYAQVSEHNIGRRVERYTSWDRHAHEEGENKVLWRLRAVYIRLPNLMQGFLILSSFVFCAYFWWLCYMLVRQRKKFKDTRDGLPHKRTPLEQYGGEILLFLHLLAEDLPISVTLFLAQTSCSCTFFLNFDSVIYLVGASTTALSLTLKLIQVAWNSGCFNFRENYLCSNRLVCLRLISILFLTFTWALTAINLVLLRAGKEGLLFSHTTFNTSVFDKLGVDRYIQDHHVAFAQSDNLQFIAVKNRWNIKNLPEVNGTKVISITSLQSIADATDRTHVINLSCWDSKTNATFTSFFKPPHQLDENDQRNCSVIFKFRLDSFSREIQYDARYTFTRQSTEACVVDELQIDQRFILNQWNTMEKGGTVSEPEVDAAFTLETPLLFPNNTVSHASNTVTGPRGHSNSQDSSRSADEQTDDYENHTQQTNLTNYLSFISSLPASKYKDCKYYLVPNNTMLSENDICVYSF